MQETSGIILENIYIIMITNGCYKGDNYIMKKRSQNFAM